ncbi:MAG: choice-of-anchor tandem repeat GloVer-containing protein [Candidatus Cybelea sp.]
MDRLSIQGAGFAVALLLLPGCGGTQPPTGAPGTMPLQTDIAPEWKDLGSALPAVSYKALYEFEPSDGEDPVDALISVKGEFYGTTFAGGSGSCGSGGCGTVYKINKHGVEAALHRFGQGSDGINPDSGLLSVNGTLYGTTVAGGKFGDGTVYAINNTGSEKVLYNFRGGSDGANPAAALINVNGTLYGTTQEGGVAGRCKGYTGAAGCGTVYSITTAGLEKVLHRFGGGSDGVSPFASLISVKGTLYGTTYQGGSSSCYYALGCGIVFTVDAKGSEKVLYRFKGGSDGSYPRSSLINVQGALFGTTAYGARSGCTDGCGSVYSVSLTGKENVLHRFGSGSDGLRPYAGLTEVKGTLYGTTAAGGGAGEDGTIYSITLSGTEKVVYTFTGYEGRYPSAPLLNVNGRMYSTTSGGGNSGCENGCGTVFALTL